MMSLAISRLSFSNLLPIVTTRGDDRPGEKSSLEGLGRQEDAAC